VTYTRKLCTKPEHAAASVNWGKLNGISNFFPFKPSPLVVVDKIEKLRMTFWNAEYE
jgi:hypothetical protein